MSDLSTPTVARSSRARVPMVNPLVAQSSFWSGVVRRPSRCRAGIASILLTLISLACVEPDPYSGRLNVVLIVLDAARADHIGVYGYDRDTTPFIDAFADEATRYETVISEAPFTFLAMSSLLSAGSPAVTGLVGRSGGIVPAEV